MFKLTDTLVLASTISRFILREKANFALFPLAIILIARYGFDSALLNQKHKENSMPVIRIAMHKIDERQKTDLIRGLTATAVEITKIPAERFTILIDELEDTNIGSGGKTLKELKAERQ